MAKTYQQWIDRVIRDAQKRLDVPPGWWGDYRHVRGPGDWEVRWSGRCWCWVIRRGTGGILGRSDSRTNAIARARKLAEGR